MIFVFDRLPGAEDAQNGEEGGEHDQEHADPVDAEQVAYPEFREPLPLLDELHRGGLLVELEEEREGEGEFPERQDQGGHLYEKRLPPRYAASAARRRPAGRKISVLK